MRVVCRQQSEVLLVVFDAQEEMAVITRAAAGSGPESLGDELKLLHRGGEEQVGSLTDTGLVGLPQTDLGRGGENLPETFLSEPGPARLTLGGDQSDSLLAATLLSWSPGAGQGTGGGRRQVQGSPSTGVQSGQAVAVLALQDTVRLYWGD